MCSEIPNKEPQQLIEEFYRQADEIVSSFGRELAKEPPPSRIYHYTDGTGLRGIIESGKLWFTDIFSLNDPTELRHGLNPAIEIKKQRANYGAPGLEFFSNIFQKLVNEDVEHIAHHFVCCFSKDGDDLGQWRAYADNGRGYAIGFDGGMLMQAFIESGVDNHATFPITYRDDRLHQMQKEIIERFISLQSLLLEGKIHNRDLILKYMTELSTSFTVHILRSALFFKHKAYTNEQEYRFLQLYSAGPLDGVKFRHRPYSLVRYREFDWKNVAEGSLKKIIIGPAAERRLARQFADNCLRAFHKGIVEIDQSEIPYRAQ